MSAFALRRRHVGSRRVGAAAGARREQVGGRRPAAERVGITGADRIRHAGQPLAKPFNLTRPLEDRAKPARRVPAEHRGRNPIAVGRAEQQRVPALSIDRDVLRLLPQRRPTMLVGINGQSDRLNGAGRPPVCGPVNASDCDQSRNRCGRG